MTPTTSNLLTLFSVQCLHVGLSFLSIAFLRYKWSSEHDKYDIDVSCVVVVLLVDASNIEQFPWGVLLHE